MQNDFFENFQYDSCVSRGICSINPKLSALQTVMVLYLRLFARYAIELEIDNKTQDFILNTIAMTIFNLELNENSFLFALRKFKEILPLVMQKFSEKNPDKGMTQEEEKAIELFKETNDIINAIKYGERIFNRGQEKISTQIRDLYSIMLVITKSLSINLLDLKTFQKNNKEVFHTILKLLKNINLESPSIEELKTEIYQASKLDNEIMKNLRDSQEERYGQQMSVEVSYSTIPNKAVLVVGSNIRELETILEAFKDEEIDIYTHDDMMLAHTFPKFSEYKRLKGQFGLGIENCLLDFATFPGPIILTKHSLHNIENLYRGRLFTTDYITSPKGIIKIKNDDYSEVISSAKESRGFKTGKQCETVTIGYNYEDIIEQIDQKLNTKFYDRIFIIGLDGYSLEQKAYFEKIIKLAPKTTLIISFSYNYEKENFIHVNSCFDYYSWIKIIKHLTTKTEIQKTVFVPKCERSSVSQIIYISQLENIEIYLGKCTPIILNPSLMNTLQSTYDIKGITSAKKDLENIFKNK